MGSVCFRCGGRLLSDSGERAGGGGGGGHGRDGASEEVGQQGAVASHLQQRDQS